MDGEIVQPSLPSRLADIYHIGKDEYVDTTLPERATLVATLGGLAFEWGTGNEALISNVGARVQELTHNPLVAGLASGGASFAEQGAIGVLMASTISYFPRVADKVRETFARPKGNEADEAPEQSRPKRFLEAMILGSGVELAKNNAVEKHSIRQNIRRALGSASMIGVANTTLVAGVAGVVSLGSEYGLEREANILVDTAANPLTYAGLFGAIVAYNKVKKWWGRRRGDEDEVTDRAHDPLHGQDKIDLLDEPSEKLRVTVAREVSEPDKEQLWGMIETGFAALNSRSHEKQSMAFEEFLEDMASPTVFKYIAYNDEERPIGLMTVHTELDDITWSDREMLEKQQEAVDPTALSYYVGTLVVTPDMRGTETATRLLQSAIRHFRDVNNESGKNSLAFFDCASANHPWLYRYVEQQLHPSDTFEGVTVEITEIGTEYWAKGDLLEGEAANKGHIVRKLNLTEEEAAQYDIVDSQHFYAVKIK